MEELVEMPDYAALADRIYACSLTQCPLHSRIDEPGCFPKFGAGGRQRVQLALITMNPGPPDAAQKRWQRQGIERVAMHSLYEDGLVRYHRESRGGGIEIRELVRSTGLDWSSVYYTEIAKCVTSKTQADDGTRAQALEICADAYLREEMETLLPTLRAVIAFGGDAHAHATRVMSQSDSARHLVDTGAVVRCPHPAARGQRFRHEFPARLASMRETLS
jgi:hypothetical protein